MFSIQYISDVHLETRKKIDFHSILKPTAEYLALCGDIGYPDTEYYQNFLEYCSNNFKQVFYVPGNHEFYNHPSRIKFTKYKSRIKEECNDLQKFGELEAKYKIESKEERNGAILELCQKFKNIHYMDKAIYRVPETDIIIIGCTLWTNLSSKFEVYHFNDFTQIYETAEKHLTLQTYNKWNEEDILFLKTVISENSNNRIIVLTHHCPTDEVILDKYKINSYDTVNNTFFANENLLSEIGNKIKVWICGHTHGCKKVCVENTIVATNTLGYEGEIVEEFQTDAVIQI
jgi:predicted phosphodiesterase